MHLILIAWRSARITCTTALLAHCCCICMASCICQPGEDHPKQRSVCADHPLSPPQHRTFVSANQYLHLQRRMDEMEGLKLGKTRANRRSDYARSHGIVNIINVGAGTGTGFQTLGAGDYRQHGNINPSVV
jgi:hypothetical protein